MNVQQDKITHIALKQKPSLKAGKTRRENVTYLTYLLTSWSIEFASITLDNIGMQKSLALTESICIAIKGSFLKYFWYSVEWSQSLYTMYVSERKLTKATYEVVMQRKYHQEFFASGLRL